MAWSLCVVADCGSEATCRALEVLLRRESRPDFTDEVPADQRDIYDAIEWLDYPVVTDLRGDQLYLEWADSETQLSQVIESLGAIGIRVPAAYVVPDDPMSLDVAEGEDDPEDGYFFVLVGGELTHVNNSNLARYFPGRALPLLEPREAERVLKRLAVLASG